MKTRRKKRVYKLYLKMNFSLGRTKESKFLDRRHRMRYSKRNYQICDIIHTTHCIIYEVIIHLKGFE